MNIIYINQTAQRSCDLSRGKSQAVRAGAYLDLTVDKQLLHSLSVSLMQASVMHPDPKGQRELQVGISDCGNDVFNLQTDQTMTHAK